jgi:hypothetical protein
MAPPEGGKMIASSDSSERKTGEPAGIKEAPPPLMSDRLRNAISRLKGDAPGPDRTTEMTRARLLPLSREFARVQADLKEAAPIAPEDRVPGQLVAGKGVYLGDWKPFDRAGESLNMRFDLFAAPFDFGLDGLGRGQKLLLNFNKVVLEVAGTRNLMGHDGTNYRNDTELYDALKTGLYQGEWFVPTQDILNGTDRHGRRVQDDHLSGHGTTDAFTGTFPGPGVKDNSGFFWSCTEQPNDPSAVSVCHLSTGRVFWIRKNIVEASVRLTRAEPSP